MISSKKIRIASNLKPQASLHKDNPNTATPYCDFSLL